MTAGRDAVRARIRTGLAESVVQEHISQVCAWLNIAHYHTKDSRGSDRGMLDSICIGPGGARAFEAKDDDGKLTEEQTLWMWLIESVGIKAMVVRPADTRSRPGELGGKSLIQRELEQIATGPTGQKFPPDVVAALKKARDRKNRELAAAIARARARGRS